MEKLTSQEAFRLEMETKVREIASYVAAGLATAIEEHGGLVVFTGDKGLAKRLEAWGGSRSGYDKTRWNMRASCIGYGEVETTLRIGARPITPELKREYTQTYKRLSQAATGLKPVEKEA